ncbi:hypothetical protein CDL15_Pgr014423 [Punica granatum]|uniref:Cyclin-like domain-containing protein n=1 Tax=Punica granatum TaxID=22663 RepID=A0A218WEI1_PUNGR|nr:hypothetical protein CDL15_Pgr014423 [Punica granatum]
MKEDGETAMEDESLSCFLCEESESCLDDEEEDTLVGVDGSNGFRFDPCNEEEEQEYVKMLLDRERDSGWFRHGDHRPSGDWIKRARAEAFSWILRTQALFGFQFQTAYLSMTYFDQFLSKRSPTREDNWAIRLLAVACLSLAAKMEEVRVPLLLEFNTKDHSFRGQVVQGMELLVLKTLEWRIRSTTPFLFLHFFVSKLSSHPLGTELLPKTIQLILGITKEIDIFDHQPSTIAAAAVLATSFNEITKEDAVFTCYGIMRGLDMDKFLNVGPTTPPDPTSSVSSSGSSPLSLTSSAASNRKRKRLAFDENDRGCEGPDDKK